MFAMNPNSHETGLVQELQSISGLSVKISESLARYTSIKVGGPADYFIDVENENALAQLLSLLSLRGMPFCLLGNGSNVLISDLGMPVRDGFDLLRTVREMGYDASRLPAIALTAFAGLGDREAAAAAGFQQHVASLSATLSAIEETLARGHAGVEGLEDFKSALDDKEYGWVKESAAVSQMWRASMKSTVSARFVLALPLSKNHRVQGSVTV